jgi:hypothetical protein
MWRACSTHAFAAAARLATVASSARSQQSGRYTMSLFELAGSAVAACASGDACEGGARACAGHR